MKYRSLMTEVLCLHFNSIKSKQEKNPNLKSEKTHCKLILLIQDIHVKMAKYTFHFKRQTLMCTNLFHKTGATL